MGRKDTPPQMQIARTRRILGPGRGVIQRITPIGKARGGQGVEAGTENLELIRKRKTVGKGGRNPVRGYPCRAGAGDHGTCVKLVAQQAQVIGEEQIIIRHEGHIAPARGTQDDIACRIAKPGSFGKIEPPDAWVGASQNRFCRAGFRPVASHQDLEVLFLLRQNRTDRQTDDIGAVVGRHQNRKERCPVRRFIRHVHYRNHAGSNPCREANGICPGCHGHIA